MPNSPPSNPIALTDDQLHCLLTIAQPLAPHDRSAFLILVATRLRGVDVIGDGLVSRVCREARAILGRARSVVCARHAEAAAAREPVAPG
jgi:hypothetical protein